MFSSQVHPQTELHHKKSQERSKISSFTSKSTDLFHFLLRNHYKKIEILKKMKIKMNSRFYFMILRQFNMI